MHGMREIDMPLDTDDWQPQSLFGDTSSSALPDLMRVMLQLPQIHKEKMPTRAARSITRPQSASPAASGMRVRARPRARATAPATRGGVRSGKTAAWWWWTPSRVPAVA